MRDNRGQGRTCRGKIEQWGMTGSNVGPKGQQGGIVMGATGVKGVVMGVIIVRICLSKLVLIEKDGLTFQKGSLLGVRKLTQVRCAYLESKESLLF